ncbi:inhibin beta A chain-like [Tubulanus polymorphus]|uniref:inhibin beta A chain-like n=1 Tax=Tubulanus polymorphus TaxID=672921 RepID=UPI003DA1D5FE
MDNLYRHIIQALVLYLMCTFGLLHAATINSRRNSRSTGNYPSWLNVVESDTDYVNDAEDTEDSPPPTVDYNYNKDCPDCEMRRLQIEKALSEKELRQIRIEMIKKQILQKLRLTERPNITRPVELPAPILDSDYDADYQATSAVSNKDTEDFYGQTTQAIVFGNQVSTNCYSWLNKPTGCFRFNLNDEVKGRDIVSAELWAFKRSDPDDNRNQTLLVTDYQTRRNQRKHLLDDARTTRSAQWVRFDVTKTVSKGIQDSARRIGFQITCKTCRSSPRKIPVSKTARNKPFLVINLEKSEKRRTRRSENCNAESTGCCLEQWYVSFEEIGWSDWILKPAGYSANNCRGSCHIPSNRINRLGQIVHSRARQSMAMNESNPVRRAAILPCCTPSKMRSMAAITTNYDGSIRKTILPNMIAESCRCS